MNTRYPSSVALLLAVCLPAFASASSLPEPAAQSISLRAVGDYVERGTPRIQVIARLGRPAERLSRNVWVYRLAASPDLAAGDSSCRQLVVRFDEGAVADLRLVNERAVEQIVADLARSAGGSVVAANESTRQ